MTALTRAVRRITVVSDPLPRGVNPRIAVTLYPTGVIGLREARRRVEYSITVARLYQRLMLDASRVERSLRKRRPRRQRG